MTHLTWLSCRNHSLLDQRQRADLIVNDLRRPHHREQYDQPRGEGIQERNDGKLHGVSHLYDRFAGSDDHSQQYTGSKHLGFDQRPATY
jgi:hypothetical protein